MKGTPLRVERNFGPQFFEPSLAALDQDDDLQFQFALAPTLQTMRSIRYQYIKRAVDVFIAMIMLILFLIPGLFIAGCILLTSRGPIFFRESRVGRGGRHFRIWKFRSMRHKTALRNQKHVETPQERGTVLQWRIYKSPTDPRITRVGGFLRKWSLDELPQLLNILAGDMSLVGPRPVVEEEVPLYGSLEHYYLMATPGLSGLWQVSGRSNLAYPARAHIDASYVQTWTLRKDLIILLRTVPAVVAKRGAR